MNNKRGAIGVALFTAALAWAAVAVVSAHHNGLYLNFDPGKQAPMAGKENYAHPPGRTERGPNIIAGLRSIGGTPPIRSGCHLRPAPATAT